MQDKRAFEACPVVSSLSVLSPDVIHQSRERGQGCEHVPDPENVDILREIGCFLQSNLKMFCYLLKPYSREQGTAYFLNYFKYYLPFCLKSSTTFRNPAATDRRSDTKMAWRITGFYRAHAWTGIVSTNEKTVI